MKDYLLKHPEAQGDIDTLINLLGATETDKVCASAIKQSKTILIVDGENIDEINYKLQ